MNSMNQALLLKQYMSNMQTNVIMADLSKVPRHWGNSGYVPDYHKFYFFLDGEGYIRINGVDYRPKRGELMLIPSGVQQAHGTINDDTYYKYWCHFSAAIGDLSIFELIRGPILLPMHEPERIEELFAELVRYHRKEEATAVWKVNALLLELLYCYFEQGGVEHVPVEGSLTLDKIESVVRYMEAHLAEPVAMDELAKIVHLHPNYFSQLFRSMLGIPPLQYLNQLRIKKAQSLLLGTELSVTQVAAEVGMELHYFSRTFRNRVGFTPSDYRKAVRP